MMEKEAVYEYCRCCVNPFVQAMLPYTILKDRKTGMPIMKKNGNPVRRNYQLEYTFYDFGGRRFHNSGYCESCFREKIDDFLKIEKHQAEIEAIGKKKKE